MNALDEINPFPRRRGDRDGFEEAVQKMTNHERNLWARAGYPGLRRRDIDQLRPYAGAALRRIAHGVGRRPFNFLRRRVGS